MQLIQVSWFFSQFLLNIHYKPSRLNVVSNALSRIPSNNILTEAISHDFNKLDALYVYNIIFVQIVDSFAIKICKIYNNNPAQNKTKRILEVNGLLKPNAANLSFEFGLPQPSSALTIYSLLIFYKNKFSSQCCLFIPQPYLRNLFKIVYGGNIHPGFAKAFDLV